MVEDTIVRNLCFNVDFFFSWIILSFKTVVLQNAFSLICRQGQAIQIIFSIYFCLLYCLLKTLMCVLILHRKWSDEGLDTIVVGENEVTCVTGHLTSFAVLVDHQGVLNVYIWNDSFGHNFFWLLSLWIDFAVGNIPKWKIGLIDCWIYWSIHICYMPNSQYCLYANIQVFGLNSVIASCCLK